MIQILVVDDVSSNRALLRKMLGKGAVRIDDVPSGEDAIQMFLDYRYDLIFMDLQMPGVDGFEAAREIRKIEAMESDRSRVSIIAVTGVFVQKEYHKLARKSGFDAWLAKPIQSAALNVILETLRNGEDLSSRPGRRGNLFSWLRR